MPSISFGQITCNITCVVYLSQFVDEIISVIMHFTIQNIDMKPVNTSRERSMMDALREPTEFTFIRILPKAVSKLLSSCSCSVAITLDARQRVRCYLGNRPFDIWAVKNIWRLAWLFGRMLHKNIALTKLSLWEKENIIENILVAMASILRTVSSTLKAGLLNGNGECEHLKHWLRTKCTVFSIHLVAAVTRNSPMVVRLLSTEVTTTTNKKREYPPNIGSGNM